MFLKSNFILIYLLFLMEEVGEFISKLKGNVPEQNRKRFGKSRTITDWQSNKNGKTMGKRHEILLKNL